MGLNAQTLESSIKASLEKITVTEYTQEFIHAIAAAVVEHIQTQAVVKVVVAGGSSAGVHQGSIS